MFSTFRHRLLFWFFVFISTNLITVGLSLRYLESRKKVEETTRQLENVNSLVLRWTNQQQNFFSYDTKSDVYFSSGKSSYLAQYEGLHEEVLNQLRALRETLPFSRSFDATSSQIHQTDSVFSQLRTLIEERGYKNYGLEGAMRKEAHWLENKSSLPAESILTLRRHEKDYIIRNEAIYVDRFNLICDKIAQSQSDSTKIHLLRYQGLFNRLVELDRVSGIKDNSGLKEKLDSLLKLMEQSLHELGLQSKAKEQRELRELNYFFGGLIAVLFIAGILVSYVIATRLTRPLKDLTFFITRFVDSNFTVEEDNPFIRTKDEIGKLTRNFTVMKNEVITRLKFFKQKVDERTEELAQANKKLIKLNEAHRRFVPQEFLKLLNKPSIEEVELGDQIEQEMTVMFTDIRSFTQLSEQLSPQQNFDFINAYLNKVVPVIEQHGGFIDKYIGDSVMALFSDSPVSAIQAALELKKEVALFNLNWAATGNAPIEIGIGIHTGKLILGTIGHNKRIQTTVISDAVNVASRVEGLTKYYGATTLITTETLSRISDQSIEVRFIDMVKVKGKSKSISIYEVLEKSEIEKIKTKTEFERALQFIREQRLAEAKVILTRLHSSDLTDTTVSLFLDRCEQYLIEGLPSEWDGIEIMKSK
jgi:class 3 adenylate cyclase